MATTSMAQLAQSFSGALDRADSEMRATSESVAQKGEVTAPDALKIQQEMINYNLISSLTSASLKTLGDTAKAVIADFR